MNRWDRFMTVERGRAILFSLLFLIAIVGAVNYAEKAAEKAHYRETRITWCLQHMHTGHCLPYRTAMVAELRRVGEWEPIPLLLSLRAWLGMQTSIDAITVKAGGLTVGPHR